MTTLLKKGKKPAVASPNDFLFEQVVDLSVVLPKIPATFGHETGFTLHMFGNGPDDSVEPGFEGAGDCVLAGACEEIHLDEHAAKRAISPLTGKEAIAAYSAVTGYVLDDENTDQGTDVREALSWRRKTGLADAKGTRHKIGAYLALEPGNLTHLYAAMYIFGAVGIGIEFPDSAMDQFNEGKPWDVVAGEPAPTEGHYIPLVARRKTLEVITWSKVQAMTLRFYQKYCDEAWAIVPTEYLNAATGKSPEGFNQAALNSLLTGVK